MKYLGMPMGMWALFAGSFRGYDADTAREIERKAKPKYKEIIRDLPEFERPTASK